jgi:transmembrane sensor
LIHADENLPASAAGEIEAQAAAWLRRRHDGWSEAHQAEFETWLATAGAHQVAFWRLEAAWERGNRLEVLRRASSPAGPAQRPNWLRFAHMAAAIVAVAVIGTATYFATRTGDAVYATALGERKVISLGDGSQIELNTNSSLRIAAAAGERKVVLERGEAFFKIVHDAAHPFTVIARGHRITDLGTKFSVREGRDSLQVTLVEGSAEIAPASAADRDRSVVLKPGEVAVATAASIAVLKKPAAELADEMAWRRGMLIFDHTTLADAAAEFNRYNDAQLVIADRAIAKQTIGGKFSTGDVSGFVEIMQQLMGLRVERQGRDFVISR